MITELHTDRLTSDSLPIAVRAGLAISSNRMNGTFNQPKDNIYYWPPSNRPAALNEIKRFLIEQARLEVPVDFTSGARSMLVT